MNEQEMFWKGDFGDIYVERNNGSQYTAAKIDLFSKALNVTKKIETIIELGANRGLNATALKSLHPNCHYTGIEIGDKAFSLLEKNQSVDACYHQSIHEFDTSDKFDLTLIAGVLIHLNPNTLQEVYRLLASLSNKYVLIAEYYNPTPVEISYRGHEGKLFKRDFAKEFMEESGFHLLDYGFVYRNDPKFSHDDMNWFLLEK